MARKAAVLLRQRSGRKSVSEAPSFLSNRTSPEPVWSENILENQIFKDSAGPDFFCVILSLWVGLETAVGILERSSVVCRTMR